MPPVSFTSRGFSIMEIVISLMLLGIGVLAVGQGYKAGRVFLRQSDNRSYAIALANQKMEEYLAKSYEALVVADSPFKGSVELADKRVFEWEVVLEKRWEGDDDPGTPEREGIPYKFIDVRCAYNDRNLAGRVETNEVRLVNIVPYPAVHTETAHLVPAGTMTCGLTASSLIRLPIRYETDKDLMIVYNITIKVEDAAGIEELDTIYTECAVDGDVKHVVTRTPILMQPLISNALGVQDLKRDTDHEIEIRWYKEKPAGTIVLKETNLIVLATERK